MTDSQSAAVAAQEAVTAEEAKTMQDTPELPPLPDPHKLCGVLHEVCSFNVDGSKLLESHDNRYPVFTADQMREYVLADRATRLAAAPKGWKLVEDFHVGDRVIFDGVEHIIFALGDRPGTFDIQLPSGKGDRWRNVPPSALKYAAAPDAAPAASSPEAADERTALVIAGWQAAIDCHTRHGMAGWSSHRDDYIRAALAVAADEGRDKALRDAATSLETIAALAGRKTYGDPPIETYMDTFMDVRLYAAARAKVAREALPAASQDEHQEQG